MISTEVGNYILLKLDDGDDLFTCLEEAASKHQFDSAIILTGLGMLRDFEISFFNRETKEYETLSQKNPMELVSMTGSLAMSENGAFMPHIHVSLGGSDHSLKGGHLRSAKVAILNEITLVKLPQRTLSRKLNTDTRLHELSFPEKGLEDNRSGKSRK